MPPGISTANPDDVRRWARDWLERFGQKKDGTAATSLELARMYVKWLGSKGWPKESDGAAYDAWTTLAEYQLTHHPQFHAWEYLLEAIDPAKRTGMGAFYTPGIIALTLAHKAMEAIAFTGVKAVNVIDPACGTGALLRAILDEAMRSKKLRWNVRGIEKDPATALVARETLSRLTLFRPKTLTVKVIEADALECRSLSDLGIATRDHKAPLIILGNPPYSTSARTTGGEWIDSLLDDYRAGMNEKKLAISDDYVRFIRWSQYQIEQTGTGALAIITSRTFLEGLTHRRMRESLRETFKQIYVLDLGGEVLQRRSGGEPDENIFPICSGVAIVIFVRRPRKPSKSGDGLANVFHVRIQGTREDKIRAAALQTLSRIERHPLDISGGDPWVPGRANTSVRSDRAYKSWPSLKSVFGVIGSGIQTKNDNLWTADSPEQLVAQIENSEGFTPDPEKIRSYGAAPFVRRHIYYDPKRLGRARGKIMVNMLLPNLGLVFARQSANEGPYDLVMVTNELIVDRYFYSRRGTPFLAPLYLHDGASIANIADEFVARFIGLDNYGPKARPFVADDARRLWNVKDDCASEKIFAAMFAILASRVYRRRFDHLLRADFPRIPTNVGLEMAERLAREGRYLIELQCRPVEAVAKTHEAFTEEELSRAQAWSLGGYQILKRWGRDLATPLTVDSPEWQPILQRWRAIERALDWIDPIVEELLDRYEGLPVGS